MKPTGCDDWCVQQLVDHLIAVANITAPRFPAEDIRRAVGSKGDQTKEHVIVFAEANRKTGSPLFGKRRSAGLRSVADDVNWSAGEGPEVRGPAMSLILGVCGRRKALDDCEGAGVDAMRSR